MLNIEITPHREFLPANEANQKMFLMMKLRPSQTLSASRAATAFTFVIDTSGSMREIIVGEGKSTGHTVYQDGQHYNLIAGDNLKTKMDIVIESLRQLVNSGRLDSSDRIAIVQFDDSASTLLSLTPATEIGQIQNAIERLNDFSGGTRMGLGMRYALEVLSSQTMSSRRALIFTDGQTFDEDQCRELALDFAKHNIPITALGVGEYEEDLLINLSDSTGGRLFHVDPQPTNDTAVSITDLPNTIIEEFGRAQQDGITNLALTVKTVKGIQLTRVTRVYPEQAEFPLHQEPYPIGNAAVNDETVFMLEFNIDSRPPARVRLAQLGLTYDIPGKNYRGELPPQNVVIQFVAGQMAAQMNQEVMGYVQQRNVANLVDGATQIAESNPQKAELLLETARKMTIKIGNQAMTQSLTDAQDELRKTRKLSAGTRKTVKMGSKGKTVCLDSNLNDELSEEAIRQASGT